MANRYSWRLVALILLEMANFITKDFYTPVNVITYNVVLNYYGERTFSL